MYYIRYSVFKIYVCTDDGFERISQRTIYDGLD